MKENQLMQSVVCTAVFAFVFGIVVSCGHGSMKTTTIMPTPATSNATGVTLSTSPSLTNAIFTTNSGAASIASMFNLAVEAPQTSLAQSFQGVCQFANNPFAPDPNAVGAHVEYGNAGFVALNILNYEHSCGPVSGNQAFTPLPAIGAGDSSTPRGSAIFFSGNISVLVAFAITTKGQSISCRDTTSTATVHDGQMVMPYLRLSDYTVMLGSGPTQLTPSCQLPVAAGDDISQLNVNWAKN
jgi:hypothetical protein